MSVMVTTLVISYHLQTPTKTLRRSLDVPATHLTKRVSIHEKAWPTQNLFGYQPSSNPKR